MEAKSIDELDGQSTTIERSSFKGKRLATGGKDISELHFHRNPSSFNYLTRQEHALAGKSYHYKQLDSPNDVLLIADRERDFFLHPLHAPHSLAHEPSRYPLSPSLYRPGNVAWPVSKFSFTTQVSHSNNDAPDLGYFVHRPTLRSLSHPHSHRPVLEAPHATSGYQIETPNFHIWNYRL